MTWKTTTWTSTKPWENSDFVDKDAGDKCTTHDQDANLEDLDVDDEIVKPPGMQTPPIIPAALHTTYESRIIASKYYRKISQCDRCPDGTYIDPKIDLINLWSRGHWPKLADGLRRYSGLDEVQEVAIESKDGLFLAYFDVWSTGELPGQEKLLLDCFPSLRGMLDLE